MKYKEQNKRTGSTGDFRMMRIVCLR